MMISPSCNIQEFIEAVKDKDYFEVISFADKEALTAWRSSYRTGGRTADESASCKRYVELLKEIARHIKSSVAPDWKRVAELRDLRHLVEEYMTKENEH
jgi:hypothetical protein